MAFDVQRELGRRQRNIERAPIARRVDVSVRVRPPAPSVPVEKKRQERPLRKQLQPFYMVLWDEDAPGAAIVQSTGLGWQLVARPTLPEAHEEDLDRPDNEYGYVIKLGNRHHLVRYYNGSLEALEPRWAILSTTNLRETEWTEDEDESFEAVGVDGNGSEWWRDLSPTGETFDAQRSVDRGESWSTEGDLYGFESGGDVAVHPTESIVAFLDYLGPSAVDSFTLYSDGNFSNQKFIADVDALGAALGPEGSSAFVGGPDRIGKYILFTSSGRLLMLLQVSADGGEVGTFNTDYALLFRADDPYTSFDYTVVAGPHASGAWNTIDDVKEGHLGLALSRDASKLFMYSNHSPDVSGPEGPFASSAAEGHVYMSIDDGETVTELASPEGPVRGIFYYRQRNTLFAQMSDGTVKRMTAPGSEGATWSDATANLLTVLNSENVRPYVNMGIWA